MIRKSWGIQDRLRLRAVMLVTLGAAIPVAQGDLFEAYESRGSFRLPASREMAVQPDGRLLTVVGDELYRESGVGSRVFGSIGRLPGADFPSGPFGGPAFLRVSPDGTRVAVGNAGGASYSNFQVGVFDLGKLTGDWYKAGHFDGTWIDGRHLAISAGDFGKPAQVAALDTSSNPNQPVLRTLIHQIGGSPSGVAFDRAGRLFTGNGYKNTGPSDTGWIKGFAAEDWRRALGGGEPLNFETSGRLVADLLSASALGFDLEGNLHVGGGDLFGSGDGDYAALVRAGVVERALAGGEPARRDDPCEVRRFDPDGAKNDNFYDVGFNDVTGELYFREGADVYVFVPEPGGALGVLGVLAVAVGLRRRGERRYSWPASRFAGRYRAAILICTGLTGLVIGAESPFAARVIAFEPAPGQFVNHPQFNDPQRALGAPVGGGTRNADNTKLVSLGGFGGSITLAFDHTVLDQPANAFGMDAIVFGNAFWAGGHRNRHHAECAVAEISLDVNRNGLADDPWYLIPGSHLADPPRQWQQQTWDDDANDPRYPPDDPEWIPPGKHGVWSTHGWRLPPAVFDKTVLENPNGLESDVEGIWGYADYAPVLILGDWNGDNVIDEPNVPAGEFYTSPDDPRAVGLSAGSCGGDAFDIAWAIDPATGARAGLGGFDFIRITNGVNFVAGVLGEISPEIGGVADVRPGPGDLNCDGRINFADINPFVLALGGKAGYQAQYPECFWRNADCSGNGQVGFEDINPFVARLTGGEP